MRAMRFTFLPLLLLTSVLAACLAGCASTRAPTRPRDTAATVSAPPERQIVVTVRNGGAAAAQGVGSSGASYGGLARYQPSPAALRDAVSIARRHGLRQLAAWPIEVLDVHCIVYAVDDARGLEVVLDEVRADRAVESVQPLRLFRAQSSGQSTGQSGAARDDPYLGLQDSVAVMQVEEAHRWSRGAGVRIAVVDSGVDDTHPDLAGRIVVSRDLTGAPQGSGRHDLHGTAVAGVIAANEGNGTGIVGIAPDSSVLALRGCWQEPRGETQATVCNTLTLARALALSLSERADIINLSLTGPSDPLLERLLRRALAMGKIVVAAVPEAPGRDEGFPANLSGVIAVASAGGPTVAGFPEALRAPGHNVLTLRPEGRYDFESGSSMAAANVTGIAALLRSLRHDVTAADLRMLLQSEPRRTDVAEPAAAPMVNACQAVVALLHAGECGALRRMHAIRQ
jgi:hypothetical protein